MMTDSMMAGVLAVIADASLKATLVLVAAGLWTLLDRSASAAMRHLVWLVALGSALVLPAIVPVAPEWRVSLPLPERPSLDAPALFEAGEPAVVWTGAEPPATWSADETAVVAVAPVEAGTAGRAVPPQTWAPGPVGRISGDDVAAVFGADGADGAGVLLCVWLAGMIATATPRLRARSRLRRIEAAAAPVGSLRVRGEARAVVAALGVRRAVRLLEGPSGSMPMTWGVFRPVVLMPADAWTWTPDRLRAVLRHELAHVKRVDALAHAAAEIACVLHWFNPLVWYGAKRLREESEHACDDRVLAHGGDPADYAAELVELARSLRPARAAALGGMAMARGRSLRGRLIAVLDDRRDRRPVSTLDALRAVVVGMFVMMPLACLAPAGRSGPEPWVPDAPEAAVVWAAPEPPSTHVHPAEPVATPHFHAEEVESPDVPQPRSYASGDAVAPVAAPRTDRPEIRPSAHAWSPPGGRPVNPARSMTEPPTPVVGASPVQRRGPDADLTERVLRQAAGGLGDRQMADLLELAAAAGRISNEATRSAFLDAARTIGGDSDRARALDALLATGLDEAGMIALVDVAAGIGSDRHAAAVLEKAARAQAVTPALREAILAALDRVGSDREKRRVLAALERSPAGR